MKEKETYVYYTDASYFHEQNCYSTAFICSRKNQKEICNVYAYKGDKLFKRIQSNGSEVVGAIRVLKHMRKNKKKIKKVIFHYDNEVIKGLAEGKIKANNHIYQEYLALYKKMKNLIEFRKTTNKDVRHKKVDKAAYKTLKKYVTDSKIS